MKEKKKTSPRRMAEKMKEKDMKKSDMCDMKKGMKKKK